MKGTAVYHSPFGKMQLDWEDGAVTALQLAPFGICEGTPNELTALVFRQLDEYFSGTRRTFDFPCRLHGTPFQQRVWAALREIPYGETRSYKPGGYAAGVEMKKALLRLEQTGGAAAIPSAALSANV